MAILEEQMKLSAERRSVDVRLANATLQVVRAVISKEIAANLAEPLRSNINKSADTTISWIIDDYCGTSIHSHRTPRPMPGPHGVDLAVSVATFANLVARSERFREELLRVAGEIAQKAYGA
jgi:hypothetical protein